MSSLPRRSLFSRIVLACSLAVVATVVAARQPAPPPTPRGVAGSWTIESLGSIGNQATSIAYGMNNRGEIVGYSYTDPDAFGAVSIYGYVWEAGRMENATTPVGPGYALSSVLYDINDLGTAVGTFEGEIYLYRDGRWTPVITRQRERLRGAPVGINRSGAIALSVTVFEEPYERVHGYLYQNGMLFDVGSLGADTYVAALNDRGAVVGISRTTSFVNRAFLYENRRIRDLGTLGGEWARAVDINDQGVIVGSSVASATGPETTFIYERGRMRALFSHPDGSRPTAINNRGEVIGHIGGEDGPAFLYRNGQLVMLADLPAVVAAGWTDLVVEDINDRGWITGYGQRNGETTRVEAFVLKPR